MKKAKISLEYVVVISFAVFVVICAFGIAIVYSGSVKDRVNYLQINNCADKIISSAESVFYSGSPSKTTISCYLPESVRQIDILDNNIFFTSQAASGIEKVAYSSKVPISGNIPSFSGQRKIQISAGQNSAVLSLV